MKDDTKQNNPTSKTIKFKDDTKKSKIEDDTKCISKSSRKNNEKDKQILEIADESQKIEFIIPKSRSEECDIYLQEAEKDDLREEIDEFDEI